MPATPAPGDASDPEESEWDLNNPEHCVEVLENRFPFHEISQAGVTIDQFNKISRFYVDSLKRKVPKAPLSQHFLKDLEDITASKKNRMNWLTCWGKQGSNSSFLKSLRSRPGAPRKNATPMGYRSEMKGMY